MKTNSRNTAGQAKDKSSSPNPLVEALWRGGHWVWGPNRHRAIKERNTATNNDRADNQACSPPHNIQATTDSFKTVNQSPELLRKTRRQFFQICTLSHRKTPAPTHTDAEVSLDRRYIFPLSRCVRDKTSTTPYEVQNNDSPAQEARQQGLHHGS